MVRLITTESTRFISALHVKMVHALTLCSMFGVSHYECFGAGGRFGAFVWENPAMFGTEECNGNAASGSSCR
jgi:hypothetical protein